MKPREFGFLVVGHASALVVVGLIAGVPGTVIFAALAMVGGVALILSKRGVST